MRGIISSLLLLLPHLLQFLEELLRSLGLLLLLRWILYLGLWLLNWLHRRILGIAGIHLLIRSIVFVFAFLAGVRLGLLLLRPGHRSWPALWRHDHALDD